MALFPHHSVDNSELNSSGGTLTPHRAYYRPELAMLLLPGRTSEIRILRYQTASHNPSGLPPTVTLTHSRGCVEFSVPVFDIAKDQSGKGGKSDSVTQKLDQCYHVSRVL
jgi:hypothetical protein